MKKIYCIIASLFILHTVSAQTVRGIIQTSEGARDKAIVSFYKAKDSSLLKITTTDKSGLFSFETSEQHIFLTVQSVGFEMYRSKTIEIRESLTDIPPILLKQKVNKLESVTVSNTRALLQYKGDKLIVNVDAMPSVAGASLLEMLAKMPGVSVDPKGVITFRGKTGVMIMVDGRETFLSGEDLINLLRSTPASGSDQVELISNPSSRYDATATGGIINIRTKKSLKQGANGSLTLTPIIGLYRAADSTVQSLGQFRSSMSANYRKNKINLFGNLSYSRNNYFENFSEERLFKSNNQSNSSLLNNNFFRQPSSFYQLRVGADYYINQKSVIGLIASNSYTRNTNEGNTRTLFSDAIGNTTGFMRGHSANPGSETFNGNYNVNYKHSSPINSQEFTVDLNYIIYRNLAAVDIESYFFNPSGQSAGQPLLLQQRTNYDFDVYVIKTDYSRSLGKWKMESGIKSGFTKSISDQNFMRNNGSGYINDAGRSNSFDYKEMINALYLIFAGKIGKADVQLGMRSEQTIGNGYQRANDSSFKRNRTDFFPSAVVNYSVSAGYDISFSYSRKLFRPAFRNLNPFVYVTDSLYSFQGNPFLLPQFSHSLELDQTFKNKFNLNIAYYYNNKLITNLVINEASTKITRTYVDNFNTYTAFIVSLSLPFKPAAFWDIRLASDFVSNQYKGTQQNVPIDLRSNYGSFSIRNTFSVGSLWTIEGNASYTTKLLSAMMYFTNPLDYSFSLRRKFSNNKGSITFNANSPFYMPVRRGEAAYANTFYNQRAAFTGQNYSLSINLRFGKNTVDQQRSKKNATAEEQGRL